jgi:hypothetical protein
MKFWSRFADYRKEDFEDEADPSEAKTIHIFFVPYPHSRHLSGECGASHFHFRFLQFF